MGRDLDALTGSVVEPTSPPSGVGIFTTMKIVREHRARAAEYDALARRAVTEPALQKHYADLAQDFDRMAKAREGLLAKGLVASKL